MKAKSGLTLWYNPHCGTCRRTAELAREAGIEPTLVEYLKTPPSESEIDAVCRMAGLEPQAIAREKEDVYASIAAKKPNRAGWIRALHDHPELIQRPIAIYNGRALVARPPERLRELL